MEKISPIEMLDKVLHWFAADFNDIKPATATIRQRITEDDAFRQIFKDHAELQSGEFIAYSDIIFIKLVKDDYVSLEYLKEPRVHGEFWKTKVYTITFEGKIFSKEGGYQGKINRLNAENTRLEKLEKAQRDYRRAQIWLTILVAVGTLIPAIPYIIRFLKYWHWI